MANAEHIKVLKRGVKTWNEWRYESEIFGHELAYVDLTKIDLRGINLKGADLREADLRGTNLNGVDLKGANLYKADLTNTNLAETDLSNADLAGAKLRKANLENAYLHKSYLRGANLYKANLKNAEFSEAILRGADLREADLSGANLRNTNLCGAKLQKALLCGAVLNDTKLGRADLTEADLSGTNLYRTNLIESILRKTIFNSSVLVKTVFSLTDLSTCIGLETIRHIGPSIIDGNTTILDYKNLPVKFLKGCGLKDWQIEAIKLNDPDIHESQITDLVYEIDRLRNKSPIQPYSVFISYSRKDEEFVERIEKVFNENGIRFWRDVHHATAGPLEKQISSAIHINPTVLLVLSEQSVKSDWVQFEVRKARELEQKLNRHVICPVAIDDSWKTCNWPERLRYQIEEYNILDFSRWKDIETFKSQIAKLFKGLSIYYRDESD